MRSKLVPLSLALVSCVGNGNKTAHLFGPPQRVAVGEFPLDVAIGDLTGDGLPDLVSADTHASSLSVLLGTGGGAFVPAAAIPIEAQPHLVAVADADRDGDLDVFATGHDDVGVFLFLGDGAGAFTPAPGSPFAAFEGEAHNHGLAVGDVSGSRAWRFTVTDLDLDGAPDVVAGAGDRLLLFLGASGGELLPASWDETRLGQTWSVESGDLDGDWRPDLVAPDATQNALRIWLSTAR